jgi:hypothetical protein
MDDKKPDPRTIAEEAVGGRLGSAPPDAAKAKAEMPPEDAVPASCDAGRITGRHRSQDRGGGLRGVGDAYADATTERRESGLGKLLGKPQRRQVSGKRRGPTAVHGVAAGFALGYAAALLIHRRP